MDSPAEIAACYQQIGFHSRYYLHCEIIGYFTQMFELTASIAI